MRVTRGPSTWRWLGIAVCVVLTPVSALASLQMVNETEPRGALAQAPLATGFAAAGRAARLIRANTQELGSGRSEADTRQLAIARRLSRKAIAVEPFNPDALRNLALLALPDEPRSRALLQAAAELSRRDAQTNLLLARAHARRGDLSAVMATFDTALRSSLSARDALLPALADVLAQNNAVAPMAKLLRGAPEWEPEFWAVASRNPAALDNLTLLRRMRAQDGYVGMASHDRALLRALLEQRRYQQAERLSQSLGVVRAASAGPIRNGNFQAMPGLAPFGWELRYSGSMTSDIDPQAGILRIQTFSNGGGLAARQLLNLPDESYRLAFAAQDWEERDGEALSLRLSCAKNTAAAVRVDLVDPAMPVHLRKPDPACRYYWLELRVRPQTDRRENAVTLRSIELVGAAPGAPAEMR